MSREITGSERQATDISIELALNRLFASEETLSEPRPRALERAAVCGRRPRRSD